MSDEIRKKIEKLENEILALKGLKIGNHSPIQNRDKSLFLKNIF